MTKISIKMNDGSTQIVEVEDYNAQEIADMLNDSENNMCAIGTGDSAVVVQRYSVVRVTPTEEIDDLDDKDGSL